MGVQNHSGTWSAPKGKKKVNDNDEWETTKEASPREILEEVKITHIKTKQQITVENMNQYFNLDECLYLECIVDNYAEGRRIGLCVIHVNEEEFKFELGNKKENQVIIKNKNKNFKWRFLFGFSAVNG